MNQSNRSCRQLLLGFTLIEVIAAMLASTVLVIALASAIVVSTNLLEVPPSSAAARYDHEIADRLASDLRYASDVSETGGFGFEITKPNALAAAETARYDASSDGLTRRVGSGPVMALAADAPSRQFVVDGYSAPTYVPTGSSARVRATSRASTVATDTSLDIDVPPGSRPGDLMLICISAKTSSGLAISPAGWQTVHALAADRLRLLVAYRVYDETWSSSTISAPLNAAISAAMLAIENVDGNAPVDWSGSRWGYAVRSVLFTHPRSYETTGFTDGQLNIQVFAAESDPWYDGTLGMASFTDVVQVTSSSAGPYNHNTLGVVVRTGPAPSLSVSPRSYHQASGLWLQSAIRLEVAP